MEPAQVPGLPEVPRVLDAGAGTAIVCSHGMSLDCDLFRPQVDGLASERLRVLAYDFRARGTRALEPYDLYDLAADFTALLDAKGIERAFLVGMSMGGAMAVRAAIRYPERVAGVILVGSSGVPYDAPKAKKQEDDYASRRHQPVLDPEWAHADAQAHFSARSRRERPELAQFLESRIGARTGEESWYEACTWTRQDDLREQLRHVEVPFLIVHGDEDALVPLDMALETFSLLPHARLLVLPYASHAVNLEEPAAVNNAISAFVAETLPG